MKGVLANLLIKLGLDNKEFNDGLNDAKNKTNYFADGMKKIGGMIAGIFAVEALKNFAQNVLQLGKETIKIENELTSAIKSNGKEVASTLADYGRFTKEMMKISTVDDEAISGMLRLAETLQSNAPKEATKNAMALSKALGVDLNTAVKMAVMAQNDMYTMLGRYVPSLRDAGTAAERTTEYNKLLASGITMMSDEVNTNIGKAEQLKIAWDNVKESWGVAILESKLMAGSIKLLGDYTEFYTSKQIKWWEKLIATIDVTGNVYKKGLAKIDLLESARKSEEGQRAYMESFTKSTAKIVKSEEQIAEEKEKALKILERQNEEIKKQADLLELIITNKQKSLSEIGAKAVNPEDLKKTPTGTEISAEFTPNMFALSDEVAESIPFDTAAYQEKIAAFNDFKNEMQSMVADFGVDVVEQFGESLGEMIATGNFDFSTFGQNVLAGIGGFLVNLGKMMIQFGIASEAFQTLLKNIEMPGAPLLLIAAGAGLVLLGGMIKGAAKAGPSGAGAGSSGSISAPSYSKANYSNSGMRAEDNKVIFEIKGDRLVGVLANTTRKNGNIR